MRFNIVINQVKCVEIGIGLKEAALIALFNELPSWADENFINNKAYYFLSRHKVIDELPMFFNKPDTVYRYFVKLSDLGLIEYFKHEGKDYFRLTTKGKSYNQSLGKKSELRNNSEKNPSEFGKKSEFLSISNSEKNPTYNNTSNNTTKDDGAIFYLKNNHQIAFENFELTHKRQIIHYDKFLLDFDDTVILEGLEFNELLFARLGKYARNYILNQSKFSVIKNNESNNQQANKYLDAAI